MESRTIAAGVTHGVSSSYDHVSPYAGYRARLLAFLIDQVLLLSVFLSLVALAAGELFIASDYGEVDPSDRSYYIAFSIIGAFPPLWVLYHAVLWGISGKTLGKMIMGIQVVRRDGERIGFGRAALRTLAYTISAATLHIGTLLGLFGEERRAMHDILSGTVVATDEGVRLHREFHE